MVLGLSPSQASDGTRSGTLILTDAKRRYTDYRCALHVQQRANGGVGGWIWWMAPVMGDNGDCSCRIALQYVELCVTDKDGE